MKNTVTTGACMDWAWLVPSGEADGRCTKSEHNLGQGELRPNASGMPVLLAPFAQSGRQSLLELGNAMCPTWAALARLR